MKRADAESDIRSKPLRCRGPHRVDASLVAAALHGAVLKDRATKANHLADPANDPAALPPAALTGDHDHPWHTAALHEELASLPTREGARKLLEIGQPYAAHVFDTLARGNGCGADFNDIVCAGPLDGREHPYTCAQCGVSGVYQAPPYDIDGESSASSIEA